MNHNDKYPNNMFKVHEDRKIYAQGPKFRICMLNRKEIYVDNND